MKQFLTLLKVDLINSLSINTTRNSKKRNVKGTKKKSGKAGIIFFIVFMYVLMSFYTFSLTATGVASGVNDLGLAFASAIGLLMVLVFTFSNAYAVLFKSKDYELLMSLPIKTSLVIASKLTACSLLGYLYFSFTFIPALIFYQFFNFDIVVLLCGILVFLFGPLLVLTLSAFLSLIIGRLTAKLKYKNAITSIFFLLFMIVIMVVSFKIGYGNPGAYDDANAMYEHAMDMRNSFCNYNPLSEMMLNAVNGDLLNLGLFALISILPFALFLFVGAKLFVKLNATSKDGYKDKNFNLNKESAKTKATSPVKALIGKEFKTFIGTPVYLTNVALSPIMGAIIIIAGAYVVAFKGNQVFGDDFEAIKFAIPTILIAASAWAFGISPATAVSINMEGRKFWLLKSLPVDDKTILLSKVLFNLVLYLPFIIISSIVSIIFLKPGVVDAICLFLAPIIYTLTFGFVGLLLNTRFYNIDWDNPTQAVKQGAGMLLTMLIDMGISFTLVIPIVLTFIFGVSLGFVTVIFGLLVCVLFGFLLVKIGTKNFAKITA